jgi:hypothetical protein
MNAVLQKITRSRTIHRKYKLYSYYKLKFILFFYLIALKIFRFEMLSLLHGNPVFSNLSLSLSLSLGLFLGYTSYCDPSQCLRDSNYFKREWTYNVETKLM